MIIFTQDFKIMINYFDFHTQKSSPFFMDDTYMEFLLTVQRCYDIIATNINLNSWRCGR